MCSERGQEFEAWGRRRSRTWSPTRAEGVKAAGWQVARAPGAQTTSRPRRSASSHPTRAPACRSLPCYAPQRRCAAASSGPGSTGKGRLASWSLAPALPGSEAVQTLANSNSGSGSVAGQRPSPRPTSGVIGGETRRDAARPPRAWPAGREAGSGGSR